MKAFLLPAFTRNQDHYEVKTQRRQRDCSFVTKQTHAKFEYLLRLIQRGLQILAEYVYIRNVTFHLIYRV